MTKFIGLDEQIPPKVIIGFMAPPDTGKTYYAIENAYAGAKEDGGNILFISTEKPTPFTLNEWIPILEKKYDVKPKLNFKFVPNAVELLRFVGIETEIDWGGKTELPIKKAEISKAPIREYLTKEKNVLYIIIDSMTAPFSNLSIGGNQNLNVRSQAEEAFFSYFINIISQAELPVKIFTTNHVTFNPTNPYDIKEHIQSKGGKIIRHYTEIVYAIELKDRPHGYRVIHVVRYGAIAQYGKSYDMLIDGNGWRRVSTAEVAALKEQQFPKK